MSLAHEQGRVAYGPITRDKEAAGPGLGFVGGRLAFPALAAGGLCTADALARFLAALARAYGSDERSKNGQGNRRRRFRERVTDIP